MKKYKMIRFEDGSCGIINQDQYLKSMKFESLNLPTFNGDLGTVFNICSSLKQKFLKKYERFEKYNFKIQGISCYEINNDKRFVNEINSNKNYYLLESIYSIKLELINNDKKSPDTKTILNQLTITIINDLNSELKSKGFDIEFVCKTHNDCKLDLSSEYYDHKTVNVFINTDEMRAKNDKLQSEYDKFCETKLKSIIGFIPKSYPKIKIVKFDHHSSSYVDGISLDFEELKDTSSDFNYDCVYEIERKLNELLSNDPKFSKSFNIKFYEDGVSGLTMDFYASVKLVE